MHDPTFLSRSETRSNNFDAVRFALATLVLFAHSFALLGSDADPLLKLLNGQIEGGGMAVCGFFAISGFLVTASWERTGKLVPYLLKRALRIYPGWTASLLFCLFVFGPLGGVKIPQAYFHLRTYGFLAPLALHSLVRLPGVFPNNPVPHNINGSLWTIPFEICCYFVTAALGMLSVLRHRALAALLLVLLYIFFFTHRNFALAIPYFGNVSFLPMLLIFFLAGMNLYLWRDKIPYSPRLLLISLLVLTLCCRAGFVFVVPIFGTYALFMLAFARKPNWHHFGKYGDFSYGMYLYAFPVQQCLVRAFGSHLNPGTLFVLAFCITLPLAAMSWHWIESPFLRLKPRPAREVPA